jgi:putative flippase GtrA
VAIETLTTKTGIKRLGKFGIVGIFNTLIDFVIYNLLSGVIGLNLIESNIISTTVAMLVSFTANKKLVFKKHDGHLVKQAVGFYIVTAFGLYVLQTGTIHILTEVWLFPVNSFVAICHSMGINGHDEFLIKNAAKAAGTVLSLAWNFIMYKKVIFK